MVRIQTTTWVWLILLAKYYDKAHMLYILKHDVHNYPIETITIWKQFDP